MNSKILWMTIICKAVVDNTCRPVGETVRMVLPRPSLWVFYWWHFKPENWDQWMSRDTDYWQRILSNYPHCGSMSQVSSINQTTSDPSSHTAAAARPSFMNLFKSCSHSWQSFREARHAITLSITPPPYFRSTSHWHVAAALSFVYFTVGNGWLSWLFQQDAAKHQKTYGFLYYNTK